MRYKEHTVRKLEAQSTKLKTLQRAIQNSDISGTDAVQFLTQVIKEIELIVERLDLEPNE
jgi:hypothetical protein